MEKYFNFVGLIIGICNEDDKGIIRLPRQDLKRPKEMAETSHFLARKYLLYTLFTPFDLRLSDLLKERV